MTEVRDGTGEPSISATFSDSGSTVSKRSSSQASRASSDSRRLKTPRRTTKSNAQKSTDGQPSDDPSLTSFPSFSPEPEPDLQPREISPSKPLRTASQKFRERKATLAGLTSASPFTTKHNALFDDSPRSSSDIPGSLHLATDDQVERLIARVGATKLIRQYAQDLAHRDAEISSLRLRADERERELKKMLREAEVPSAEVEKRLLRVDRTSKPSNLDDDAEAAGRTGLPVLSLNHMMSQAISEARDLDPVRDNSEPSGAGLPNPPSTATRRISIPSIKGLQSESRISSQASSIMSDASQDMESTIRPRQASNNPNRVTGLQSIFQPPSNTTSYFIGGSNKTVQKAKALDEVSVKSTQSTKSANSWARLFGGGKSQPNRSRAVSVDERDNSSVAILAEDAASKTSKASATLRAAASAKPRPQGKRSVTATRVTTSQNHARKDSNASSLPPTVEMDSMVESSQLPPTMSNYNSEGLLIDRFGFIYDRKRKRRHMGAHRQVKDKLSAGDSLASHRARESTSHNEGSNRPSTPGLNDDESAKKSWQEYLLPTTATNRGRPRELLAHTPSAGAVVTVSTADPEGASTPPRHRDVSISISSTSLQALPTASSMSEPQSSDVTATSTGFSHDIDDEASELGASKALLEQLTELHDSLQTERAVKWNDFLRRVRNERANSVTERSSNNAPEAELVNGELVGIATLGRSSKTRSKYLHFKSLVLAGIPVSLRPKIWAECSGAATLHTPGYYEDLIVRSEDGSEIDQDIATQIKADVKRTLKDNVFFRSPNAPGVQRLEELLRAYSLHNPRIGYCQGMNLITASLLLICATPEDCFWLLVAIIDHILPSGYFDHSLLVARADQAVLREYVAELLPKLDAKLQDLGVELEACTFHWFLSLYTGVLTGGEALYRVWDVVLCLNSSDSAPMALQGKSAASALGVDGSLASTLPNTPTTPAIPASAIKENETDAVQHDGTSSPFLFQLSLALLKLNEEAILALDSAAQVYTYLNHNMTAHNITIDALINASEMLRGSIKRAEVLEKRKKAVDSLL